MAIPAASQDNLDLARCSCNAGGTGVRFKHAAARRSVSLAGISLIGETSSLLLITGNRPLRLRKDWEFSTLVPAQGSDIDEIPCTFPEHQGARPRDEFARDSTHRH